MSTEGMPPLPPWDGSMYILPGMVDWQAKHNPDRLCAIWPSPNSPSGTNGVTFAEFSEATHRVAHALRPNRQGKEGEVVGLLIHTDSILYMAVVAGMIRAGLVPIPMSPRNSASAVINLLEKTGSHRIVTNDHVSSLRAEVQAELAAKNYDLQVDSMPGLYDAFPSLRPATNGHAVNGMHKVTPYPPRSTPPPPDERVLYLHSSGSTGFPKPIPLTSKIMLHMAQRPLFMDTATRQVLWGAMGLPTFHAMGFAMEVIMPFTSSVTIGLYEPQYPAPPVLPTIDNFLEACQVTKCKGLLAVPSMVEAWAKSPDAINYLTTLDALVYAGGPLAKKCGDDLVARGVKLFTIYGGTEFGGPTLAFYSDAGAHGDVRTPRDWEWMQFSPAVRCRWVPQGDGSYELQLLTCETHQLAVENLPDVRGYATSDLFVPHPTKEGLWRITGRLDDVIILSNAEKIVPIPQEGHITTSPMVLGAVMFGRGREQAGVLIEPTREYAIPPGDDKALAEFRNRIWPVVEQANQSQPAFARVFKEMIIVTDPAKPLPRAAKGTIMRKMALAAYEAEIDKLYKTVEDSTGVKGIVPPPSWKTDDVEPWLLAQAVSVNDDKPVDAEKDLFEQGFDSLSATFFRNRIVAALRAGQQSKAASEVSQNFIYEYPSIKRLAHAVAALVDPSSAANGAALSPTEQIEAMIAKYTADLPTRTATRRRPADDRVVVLLTGTTGNIGSHILAALLADTHIARVYALNRGNAAAESAARQRAAFQDRGLSAALLDSGKYTPLVGDLNEDRFGLPQDVFDAIRGEVTMVVHNAWTVHFNRGLGSFESQIAGTRRLVDLCMALEQPVKLLFTSSVGVAQGWDPRSGPVPEDVLPDPAVAIGSGYSSSKYVVERVIAAARTKGLEAASLRVGQVCGSADAGAWNTSDWLPSLVKSSIALGALPELDGPVTWIPMDAVANMTLDLAKSDNALPPVLNVVHPRPSPWIDVFTNINDALGARLPFIPFEQWVTVLEEQAANPTAKTVERIPAIKLLEFFRGFLKGAKSTEAHGIPVEAGGLAFFQTARLQECSPTMQTLPPLSKAHAHAWLRYWKDVGYL